MKKLLSLFRKKTYCINTFRLTPERLELEINVNEFIKDTGVTPVNVSYTCVASEIHGQHYTMHTACILYKF